MATLQEALHDSLTGLANRELFHDRLEHACSVARRREEPVALLFIDLDEFKAVNDTLGHAAGDAVLAETARRITGELRASDTAARLGGDEFVVLLEGLTSAQAMDPARRIVEALRRPVVVLDGHAVVVGASIGIADGDVGRRSASAMVAAADEAMYRAKSSRSDQICVNRPVPSSRPLLPRVG
jgi:diguanylate cyclase (GGDEF)-like protein